MAKPTTTQSLGEIWGARIAERRQAQGFATQDRFAEVLTALAPRPASQQAISSWERGIATPRDDMKPAIAAALGTTVAELFAYPDNLGKAS